MGDCTKLTRYILIEAPDQHRPDGRSAEARLFKGIAGRLAVLDEEMGVPDAVHREDAAAFKAYTRRAERVAKSGQRARLPAQFDSDVVHSLLVVDRAMVQQPTFFPTEADFRRWLETNSETAPELLIGFWKKSSGRPSIDWPQARDQALCFGWIDGVRRSLGEEAYTIRFTPRRKGSIWSKVNVARYEALTAEGQMTPAGVRAYEENKGKSGLYSYEKPLASLTAEEEQLFRRTKPAWSHWESQPPGYRKLVLNWITTAKRPETRAKRLLTLIEDSTAGRRIAGYDWRKKP